MPSDASIMPPPEQAEEALRVVLEGLEGKSVPVSSWRRLWTLGGMQTKAGISYVSYWLRRWFESQERSDQRLREAHLNAAVELLHGMGYLRGAIMKIGQLLANLPQLLPQQFTETLDRLHFEAPPMHFALLREQFFNELGAEPEALFSSFERRAMAAASIGQVHRATLPDGSPVAVKIQYPGIGRTVEADLGALKKLLLPLRLGANHEVLAQWFEEVREMLGRETDYLEEAASLRTARALFDETDGVVVPRVVDALTTSRVLAMEYVDGLHLNEFLARNPSQAMRDAAGERIYRAAFRLYYSGKLNYGDTHPGNFLFLDDGRVGLLDFGCVRPFTDEEEAELRMAELAAEGGREEALQFLRRYLGPADGKPADREFEELQLRAFDWIAEPLRHPGAFDFGDEAVMQKGTEIWMAMARKGVLRGRRYAVYLTRSIFGIRTLLHRLRARVPVSALHAEEVRRAGWC